MKKFNSPVLWRLGAFACLCSASHAAVVSVNFVGNAGADGTLAPGDQAGDASQGGFVTNWNNASNTTGSLAALKYSTGVASPSSISWSADGVWSLASVTGGSNSAGGANPTMMKGYLDHLGSQATTITMTGIVPTAATYSVIVYFDGDNGGNWRAGTYTIGDTTFTGEDSENVNFNSGTSNNANGRFQIPVGGGSGNADWPVAPNNNEGNMVVFSGLTGNSFTLTATGGGQADTLVRAAINGIQVVGVGPAVPEPGAVALLAIAVGGLLARRRRLA